MDTLKGIKIFQEVAKLRSYSQAAERVGITVAMASRYVKDIEDQVGARLLNRTSRKVSLTEAGEIYLARATLALEGLDEASALAAQSTAEPKGVLKIILPAMMSTPVFSNLIAAYREAYPNVTLEFEVSSQPTNIIEDGFDLALHVGQVAAEGLVAKKLADVRVYLVATPNLLNKIGRPKDIKDVVNLPFILHTGVARGNKIRWRLNGEQVSLAVDPVLRTENEMMVLHAALAGVGAAVLPEWLVAPAIKKKQLEVILPESVTNVLPLYLLYPDRHFLPAKTRSFIDFMSHFEIDHNRYIYSIEQC